MFRQGDITQVAAAFGGEAASGHTASETKCCFGPPSSYEGAAPNADCAFRVLTSARRRRNSLPNPNLRRGSKDLSAAVEDWVDQNLWVSIPCSEFKSRDVMSAARCSHPI